MALQKRSQEKLVKMKEPQTKLTLLKGLSDVRAVLLNHTTFHSVTMKYWVKSVTAKRWKFFFPRKVPTYCNTTKMA